MLKNSKLLKGIVISLAFVLVLGSAFLVKQLVEASGKVVVFYVDDEGDNSTGKDIASAYTTIGAATKAASEMGLEPGTEVRILVGEKVTITTQSIDVNVVKDKNGDQLPVVLTSVNDDDPDNYAVLYHAYRLSGTSNPIPTYPSQRARIINNLTMKNIVLKSKVHEVYDRNNDTGSARNLYRVQNLYVDGNDVTFDNVRFTTDLGDWIEGKYTWTVICDNCTAGKQEGNPTVNFKNADYSNIIVYGNSAIMPNYDITVNFENTTLGTIYCISNSDKTSNQNCKSLKMSFKDSSINNLYPFNGGDYTIPGGVEYTFDNTPINNFRTKDRKEEVLTGNLTWNFKGDKTVITADNGSLYLSPVKGLIGNLTTNIAGGTFNDSMFVCGGTTAIDGNVVNNITGGTFKKFFAGGGRTSLVTGSITNNVSGSPYFGGGKFIGGNGEKGNATTPEGQVGDITNNIKGTPTFKCQYFGGSLDGQTGDVENNVEGVITFEKNYFGGGGTDTKNDAGFLFSLVGDVHNVVEGAIFQASFYGGSLSGVCGDVKNEVFGSNAYGDVYAEYYYGGAGGNVTDCGNVVNEISNILVNKSYAGGGLADYTGDVQNLLDGNVTILNYYYGGTASGYAGVNRNIINKFTGKDITLVRSKNACYIGGNGEGDCANVRNEILAENVTIGDIAFSKADSSGKTYTNYYYGGSRKGASGDVENIFNGKKVVIESVFCGGTAGTNMGNVYNEFAGGVSFKDWVFCSSYAPNGYTVKDTVNNVTNATFAKFFCGGPANCQGEDVVNYISSNKVIFNQAFYGGPYNATAKVQSLTNYITSAQFKGSADGYRTWLGGDKGTTTGKTTNVIEGVTFNAVFHGGTRNGKSGDIITKVKDTTFKNTYVGGGHAKENAAVAGNITNYFEKGVTLEKYFYAGHAAKSDSVAGNITNHLSGVTINDMYVGGTIDGKCGDVINNITAGATLKGNYYGGSYNATSDCGVVTNYVGAAKFEKTYYAGNSKGTNDGVNNYIIGSVSFPTTFVGGSRGGTCGDVVTTFYSAATMNGAFYGGCYDEGSTCGDITNTLANGTIKGDFVGGNYKAGTCGDITNLIYHTAKLEGKYFGGVSTGAATISSITNEIYTGTFKTNFIAGSSGTIGAITNTISGNVTFDADFYGGSYGSGSTATTVTNTITGATFKTGAWLGGSAGTNSGVTTNNLSGVTFKGNVFGGKRNSGTCGDVVNNITSCDFEGIFAGGNSSGSGRVGNVTNNIYANSLFCSDYIGGSEAGTSGNVVNNLYSVTVSGTYYKGNKAGTTGSAVTNILPAGTPEVVLPAGAEL